MNSQTNDITGLQAALFDTLRALQNKDDPMDIERAKAICNVGTVIVDAAKTEIDFARVNGSVDSNFFHKPPSTVPTLPAPSQQSYETKNGVVTVEGAVTRHKMK